MHDVKKVVLNWSSGKDAALAYILLQQDKNYKVTHLLTTVSQEYNRVFMHGVDVALLDMQAQRMGVDLIKIPLPASPDDTLYKQAMHGAFTQLKSSGVTTAAYGDIFLEDLRLYREQQLQEVDMQALFPLWKNKTEALVRQVAQSGIEAIIVCVNDRCLGKEFLGRKIDEDLLRDLPPDVDPCGENGEFHTFVFNAPFFTEPLNIKTGEIVYKKYMPADNDDEANWDKGFYFLNVAVK